MSGLFPGLGDPDGDHLQPGYALKDWLDRKIETKLLEEIVAFIERREWDIKCGLARASLHDNRYGLVTGVGEGRLKPESVRDGLAVDGDNLIARLQAGISQRRVHSQAFDFKMCGRDLANRYTGRTLAGGRVAAWRHRCVDALPATLDNNAHRAVGELACVSADVSGALHRHSRDLDNAIASFPVRGRRRGARLDTGNVNAGLGNALRADHNDHEQKREQEVHGGTSHQEEGTLQRSLVVDRSWIVRFSIVAHDFDEAAQRQSVD